MALTIDQLKKYSDLAKKAALEAGKIISSAQGKKSQPNQKRAARI